VSATARGSESDPYMREYLRLARIFPLTPIRDDADVRDATRMLAYVLSLGDDIPAACDYSEALGDLIWAYEQRAPAPEGTVSGALSMLMKGRGLTQTRLAREVGIAQATISNVLRGARGFTADQAVRLGDYFRVEPSAFLRTSPGVADDETGIGREARLAEASKTKSGKRRAAARSAKRTAT